jgi:DMSO/TMAO reductase YedYZ molybdopterin-dependent catalytic subunit
MLDNSQQENTELSNIKWMALGAVVAALILIFAALLLSPVPPPKDVSASEVSVSGLVNNETTITMAKLESMPSVTVTAELICVSGQSLGTHNWTGVKLKDILNEAGVQPSAIKVAFLASGYSTDLNMSDAMRDDVIVAYLEDGAQMPEITKLVVPGEWGYKWISGLESVKLVDYNFLGRWESHGYSDDATIPT